MTRSTAFPMLFSSLLVLACAACHRDDAAAASSADRLDAGAASSTPPPEAPPKPATTPAAEDTLLSHAPHPVDMPPADTPTAAIAEGAEVAYQCEDGNLVVIYSQGSARVTLPDGSTGVATLSKDASAKLGGEFYGGPRLALQRLGNTVQLQQGDGPRRQCTEASSTA